MILEMSSASVFEQLLPNLGHLFKAFTHYLLCLLPTCHSPLLSQFPYVPTIHPNTFCIILISILFKSLARQFMYPTPYER